MTPTTQPPPRRRLAQRLAAAPALVAAAVVLLALVLPVGGLLLRSLRVEEVVLTTGEVLVAAGRVTQAEGRVLFSTQSQPGAERMPERFTDAEVAEVRTRWSLHHHRFVATDERLVGLLLNSLGIALGGALLALLLGLALGFVLGGTDLPGRGLLMAVTAVPALLPPFFIALGGARDWQAFVILLTGWQGAALQRASSILVFGLVLFPLVALLVAPAFARIPAGAYEAARLLGGRRAARRLVVGPLVRPAALGAFLLAFVLALSDFAVPDLLGFMLPGGGAPTYTFATEILLQWKQEGNVGRAVATGVPFLVLTLVPALVAVLLLRRSPAFAARAREEALPPIALRRRTRIAFTLLWVALLVVAVGIPFLGIVGWVGTGESVASGSGPAPVATATSGRLGDFQGALDRTEGSRGERDRWIHTALVAAVLSLLVAVPLVRAALRRAGPWRTAVLGLGLLALATPGLALSVGTRLLHDALPRTALSEGIVPSVLALTARFLPVALLMAWLTLRQVRRGGEEAARLLGAGAWTRFATIVLRPALPGFVAAALLVLVLALRELEVVMVLDTRILPLRLYDKIHFSRLADEANLLLYCVAIQLAPAALLGLGRLLARRARPVREGGPGLP